ncbi:hypothetical protein EET67_01770 [Pseudaminobacter arsenicus]|uniref:Co-chaperone DjlA N-terminal domain-containing protein n=1 Tax=Borborobacter arsenicus TaxID=1851146 RepID=A0A432VCN3_9HYPH|nr:TerB family tellurite resistance protein [Pseudaminobacter arsenicus]RUM99921.1 hypothetical protein EET67_01770 [Pseudaminobacter arsenicus]
MATALLTQIRNLFEGDPGVRKVADDPALTAELLLLFRMILADGTANDREMAVFRRICTEKFEISGKSLDAVVEYLNDFGYEITGTQAIAVFAELDVERRRSLARHMADIAKADSQLEQSEIRLLRRTLEMLGLSPADVTRPAD